MKTLCLFFCILIHCNIYAIKPSFIHIASPEDYNMPYSDLMIETPDSATLHAWAFGSAIPSNHKLTVVIAGADAGNMSFLLEQIMLFRDNGFNVLSFDYRGFGKSSEFEIDFDQLYYDEFVIDLQSAVTHARNTFPGSRIIVYGIAMGSLIAFLAADTADINYIVAEGAITNPFVVADRLEFLKKKKVGLPAGADESLSRIANIKIPVLLIAATLDFITTVEDCEEYIKGYQNRYLLVFPGNHLDGFVTMRHEYIYEILHFISGEF
jgi:uncharacterized protein